MNQDFRDKLLQTLGYYRNNQNLRAKGTPYNYSEEEVEELIKCKEDPIYFIKNYVKIVNLDEGLINFGLRDYQEVTIKNFQNHNKNILLFGRQLGKCFCINTIIRIKNKNFYNGQAFTTTIGEFYEYIKFRKCFKDI